MCNENMGLLDPKSDYIFKLIFGTEKNKPLLLSLLNAILQGNPQITDLQLQNTEVIKLFKDGRSARLDIKAQINPQEYVDIDMQIRNEGAVVDRAIQYTQCMSSENFYLLSEEEKKKGLHQNYSYPKVIGIWITGENIFNDCDEPVTELGWVRGNRPGFITDKTRLFFIELPKFNLKTMDKKNVLDLWMAFLKEPKADADCDNKDIRRAFEELMVISASREVRENYKAIMDARISQAIAQSDAEEKGREKGIKEGIKKGRKEGIKEGREVGITEGKREKAIESAKKMLADNLPMDIVARYSGLSIEELKKLN